MWNPKTVNLSLSIDISNALDKAIEYLDSSDREESSVNIRTTKPFALRMRIYKYVKAYKEQMKAVGFTQRNIVNEKGHKEWIN